MTETRFEACNTADAALDLDRVVRRFARRWVLRGVSLTVERGSAVALMGRNGSGKTTLLRIVATALRPTRGRGTVFGHDLLDAPDAVRAQLGLLGHHAGLYDDLTALENLLFAQRMTTGRSDRSAAVRALERVRLASEQDERVRGFSAGMRRRLAFARLLLRRPRLLLLDEPYAAFDADGIALVNEVVRETVDAGGAALIATHDVARAVGVIDRTVHIVDGLLATSGVSGEASEADQAAGAMIGRSAPVLRAAEG